MKCVFHWHSVGAQGNELRLTDINQMTFKETKKKRIIQFSACIQLAFETHEWSFFRSIFKPFSRKGMELDLTKIDLVPCIQLRHFNPYSSGKFTFVSFYLENNSHKLYMFWKFLRSLDWKKQFHYHFEWVWNCQMFQIINGHLS